MKNEHGYEVVALAQGPKHHFFGYYDIQTCDSTGKYVLAIESDFDDHFPTADDTATIGMMEWETKIYHPLTTTRAWNPQQGSMLHWLPTEPDRKIIYNDRDADRFVSIVLDVWRHSIMWFNHTTVNTDDTRVAWISVYRPPDGPSTGKIALMVADLDGNDAKYLISYQNVSHHDWLDPEHFLVWSDLDGKGECFNLLNVVSNASMPVARDAIQQDGHCIFTRDGRRLAVDSYASNSPDKMQTLYLWDMQKEQIEVIGQFHQPPYAVPEWKCDLHPRGDRNDRWIIVDSTHEGSRQMYAIDSLTKRP